MTLTNGEINTCNWIYFTLATISLICTLTTLYLIHYMGIRNGYLLLITSMTVCQIIYDINFIQGVIPGYVNCVIWNVFDILGGLSVALWSNVISYVAMHVIVNVRSMSIYENYPKFFCFAMIPSVVLSMASIAVIAPPPDDDAPFLYCEYRDTYFARAIYALYFWGRIFSILFNFGVFAYISYRIHRMMKLVQSNDDENKLQRTVTANPISPLHSTVTADSSNVNTTNTILHTTQHNIGSYPINATTQCIAIVALVSRMKYYPLAQAISRSGAAWNEFLYYSYDSYPSHMMAAICSPVLGILNFLIFLNMQPKAWKTFCSFFVLPMMHTSVASSNSTTQPSLPEHLFRTATNMHSSSSLEASRIMLGDYDEDELHSYINDAFLTRQNSVFASTVQETPSNELSRRQSSMFGTIPPENSSVSAGTNLSSGTKQDITSRDSFL